MNLKDKVIRYDGKCIAHSIYEGINPKEKFGRALKRKIEEAIDYLGNNYTKRDFKLITKSMYNEFGEMGEFLPQLYILNMTKPRNINKKKSDLIRSVLEGKK